MAGTCNKININQTFSSSTSVCTMGNYDTFLVQFCRPLGPFPYKTAVSILFVLWNLYAIFVIFKVRLITFITLKLP